MGRVSPLTRDRPPWCSHWCSSWCSLPWWLSLVVLALVAIALVTVALVLVVVLVALVAVVVRLTRGYTRTA